jgi:hypothetical protein
MSISIRALAAAPALVCFCMPALNAAEPPADEMYIYATYHYCDSSRQEEADAIVAKLDQPISAAAVADGTIMSWGWLVHHTGGQWRRGEYFTAPSMEALLAAQKKIREQTEARDKKAAKAFGSICTAHDDYIWRSVAGNDRGARRGPAAFSVYYVCDNSREAQADALVKQVFAPAFDKLVADGLLASWGWNEHIVGGEYRRLATMTAQDVPSLMKGRSALIEAMQANPLAVLFNDICGSHADYIWEIKAQSP